MTKVVTGKVRFSYLHVFEPSAMTPDAEKKYSVSLIIPKSDKKTIAKIEAAIEAAAEAGKDKFNGKVPKNLRSPLRDGDTDEGKKDDEAYANAYFINANSLHQPGLVDRDRNEILDKSELYSGCYGRASINFYAYNVGGNRGIGAGLNNLQKLHDGEPLGGAVASAEDDFDDDFDDLM